MPAQKTEAEKGVSTNPPRKSYPPLGAEKANGPSNAGEAQVRAALKEGNPEAISDMGSSAKPVLFRILENQREEFVMRLAAAESALEICGDSMRTYDRVLALLLMGDVYEASSLGEEAALPLLSILKTGVEMPELRNLCVEALVSLSSRPENSRTLLSAVAGLSSLLANEQELPVLRANIAFEIIKMRGACDKAKQRMIRAALEKAAASKNEMVGRLASDALELLVQEERECSQDDENPTFRLPETK